MDLEALKKRWPEGMVPPELIVLPDVDLMHRAFVDIRTLIAELEEANEKTRELDKELADAQEEARALRSIRRDGEPYA